MFRPVESIHLARFNSATSSDFLDLYESAVDEDIREGESSAPSRTFAPSQIRCKRISWFRLRGVLPEQELAVDRTLNFTARVGTSCHQTIQSILSKKLGKDWIDAEEYLKSANLPYKYSCHKNGFETQIEIYEPVPIKFAPDGIIFYKGKYWLLEIKTSEYQSFDKLTDPKPQHIDQIKCYGTLLHLHNALVLYQDRMYGGLKCYEVTITDEDMKQIWDMFNEVQDCVKRNIAPPKLPKGDSWCNPSRCRYFNKCKEW
jgi:CRISPR/Cas system-associated exonuclease Cas4 (RecB family)